MKIDVLVPADPIGVEGNWVASCALPFRLDPTAHPSHLAARPRQPPAHRPSEVPAP